MNNFISYISFFVGSILNSYTQIFFSKNKLFATILVLVSFFDWFAGLCGFLAIVFTNIFAFSLGFNKKNIEDGLFGFNSLLVGFALGIYFNPGFTFFALLFFSALLVLMITISIQGILTKYGLPYLSIPFLLATWLITLATREINTLEISERGVFMMNEMYAIGGAPMLKAYLSFGQLNLPEPLLLYFKSLAAIFFQHHLFAGILIAMGLLIHSRISFILSLLGFYIAYFYYTLMGINIYELSHGFIGFNYILTAIAIGGYFTIPSKMSIFWVILLTPVSSIIISSTSALLAPYQLSIYSLSFNIIVILFLYMMKFRLNHVKSPQITIYQFDSPEKNLYAHVNNSERFKQQVYKTIFLPFFGEWTVSQAHNGAYTHKADWRHAWDFVIKDQDGRTFSWLGREKEDYYCYNKPVIAPADGVIETIEDNIEDNNIGEINTEKNWGNTIVIKHDDFLYTKLSHLKKGSFKVMIGNFVRKGDVLASCGNSGRSPEPHLHFQIQATPHIGSKTIDFPLAHYVVKQPETHALKSYEKPIQNENISNIGYQRNFSRLYKFIPGQKVKVKNKKDFNIIENWEVVIDIYNKTYLFCKEKNAKAYFINDGNINYFTHFEGNRKSMLFYFFLANFKILTTFYSNLIIKDSLPINLLSKNPIIFLQDFFAPFYLFLNADYQVNYVHVDDDFNPQQINLDAKVSYSFFKKNIKIIAFNLILFNDNIIHIKVVEGIKNFEIICEFD